jgi:hypothetical protein
MPCSATPGASVAEAAEKRLVALPYDDMYLPRLRMAMRVGGETESSTSAAGTGVDSLKRTGSIRTKPWRG